MDLTFTPPQMLLLGVALMAGLIYVPYLIVAVGRVSIGIDLSAPRAMFDRLPDYAKRATWAHQNSFESFALFTAAALCVFVSNTATERTSLYVLIYLAARTLFTLFYLLDWPWLRSPMWALSMVCIGGLFTASVF